MPDVVIEAHKLIKRFGDFTAVREIDFQVQRGECFGFLGPNGAGKTSTMRMIYGFSPVSGGVLKVLTKDVRDDLCWIKSRLGVIPQEDNLDPDLKVLQNLLVYARYFDIPRRQAQEQARQALELFQLWDRRNAVIRNLSGGMKRRLVIARSLINSPDILIADEPTTGLDPQARHLVWQKLRKLQSAGVTIVLTTHYMEEAAQLCDRLSIMDKGIILDTGSPSQLIEKWVQPRVVELELDVSEVALLEHLLKAADLQFESVGDRVFVYMAAGEQLPKGIQHRMVFRRIVRREASLEDVFLKLTGHALED